MQNNLAEQRHRPISFFLMERLTWIAEVWTKQKSSLIFILLITYSLFHDYNYAIQNTWKNTNIQIDNPFPWNANTCEFPWSWIPAKRFWNNDDHFLFFEGIYCIKTRISNSMLYSCKLLTCPLFKLPSLAQAQDHLDPGNLCLSSVFSR